MRALLIVGLLVAAVGCEKSKPVPVQRATLKRTGGTTFELMPSEGQHPHCLAFTVAKSGLIRQLTMAHNNQSFACPAGRPVAGHSYKVPLNEGPVRVYVFFTSQSVNAGLVAQEILEAKDRQDIKGFDLRLPGNVALERLDFEPEEDVAPEEGHLLQLDAGQGDAAVDAGQP